MIQQAFLQPLLAIGAVFLIDIVLSGDNALVISVVASTIPSQQRRLALVLGGAGAIIFRVVLTSFATLLLAIPFLRTVGGLVVLLITVQLLLNQTYRWELQQSLAPVSSITTSTNPTKSARWLQQLLPHWIQQILRSKTSPQQRHLFLAVLTIIISDITMSVDNVVALGALAKGQILILAVGLLFSIILLFVGSVMVTVLISRVQSLVLLASLMLAWVVGNLVWDDLEKYFPLHPLYQVVLYALVYAIVILTFMARRIYLYLRSRARISVKVRK